MAYGLRDTYARDVSDDYADDYGVVSNIRRFMARRRRRKKTARVGRYRHKTHKVMRRRMRKVRHSPKRKGRAYPHHLKKFMFKKGHKRKA